ncbi:hypothetical protein D9M68_827850 [compost metagenome]
MAAEPKRHASDQLLVHVARLGAEIAKGVQQPAGQPCKALALCRQAKAAPPPLAQRESQPDLQRGQLLADRRLAHAQRALRRRNAPRINDGQEDAHQPDVQIGGRGQHAGTPKVKIGGGQCSYRQLNMDGYNRLS